MSCPCCEGSYSLIAPQDPEDIYVVLVQQQSLMAYNKLAYTADIRRISRSSAVFRFVQGCSANADYLTWFQVLDLWGSEDPAFHRSFTHELASCPFQDFFWECPPVSSQTVNGPFEFVLTNAQGRLCNTKACAHDFEEHFGRSRRQQKSVVVSFLNLGGDALLVVPTPMSSRGVSKNLCVYDQLLPMGVL